MLVNKVTGNGESEGVRNRTHATRVNKGVRDAHEETWLLELLDEMSPNEKASGNQSRSARLRESLVYCGCFDSTLEKTRRDTGVRRISQMPSNLPSQKTRGPRTVPSSFYN